MSLGLSAKERLAQLQKGQDKNGSPKGPGKLNLTSKFGTSTLEKEKPLTSSKDKEKSKVEPVKPQEEVKKVSEVKDKSEVKKVDTEKLKENPPKPTESRSADTAKPKEEPKTATATMAEKLAEQPKPAPSSSTASAPSPSTANATEKSQQATAQTPAVTLASQTASAAVSKPTEQPKVSSAQTSTAAVPIPTSAQPTADQPTATDAKQSSNAVPGRATLPTAAAATNPVEQPKLVAASVPTAVLQATTAAAPAVAPVSVSAGSVTRGPDDFFTNIFYFSGMGSLIGSALAEGVYVPEKNQRNALDAEEMEAAKERTKAKSEETIVTARIQAQGLSTDLRQLQSLLDTLPTFTDTLVPQPLDKRGIDQPIHGHRYFHQSERSSSRQGASSQDGVAYDSRNVPLSGGLTGVHHPNDSDLYYQQQQQLREKQRQEEEFARRKHLEAEKNVAALSASASLSSQRSPILSNKSSYQNDQEYGSTGYESLSTQGNDGPRASHGADGFGRRPGVGNMPRDPAAAQQAWQNKYSLYEEERLKQPTPRRQDESFGEIRDPGDVDTAGIKSWQLSHIRSLEAKGYHIIDHEGEPSGSNWSYAPYLLSDRSKNIDLQQRCGSDGRSKNSPSPAPQQFQTRGNKVYQNPSQPSYGSGYPTASDTSLPYCDL